MVNHTPTPNEVEAVVLELHGLGVHALDATRKPRQLKALCGAFDCVVRKVDAGEGSRVAGYEPGVTPTADANFQDVHLWQIGEGNQAVERQLDGRQELGGVSKE